MASNGPNSWRAYRGADKGNAGLPLRVISVGRRQAESGQGDVVKMRRYWQLLWVETGCATFAMDEAAIELQASTTLVTTPGSICGITSAAPSSVVYTLKFDGRATEDVLAGFGIECRQVCETGPPPAFMFERVRGALSDAGAVGDLEAGAALYDLLTALAERKRRGDPESDRLVRRALDVIERDLPEPGLNVSELSRRLGVHRSSLSQHFARQLGVTPRAFIQSLRIRRAVELLHRDGAAVSEVAAACGYENAASFTRLLRRATGMSPSEIRRTF